MHASFLREGRYASAHRALLGAIVLLVLSVVVLLLPPSWGILGGWAGLVVAVIWALVALSRYRRERSRA